MRLAFEKYGQISDEVWSELSAHFHEKKFAKNEIILQTGDRAQFIYFIQKGVVRLFFEKGDDKQINKSFATEGKLVAGDISNSESWYGLQALEDLPIL